MRDNSELQAVVVAGNIVLDLFPPLVLPDGHHLRDLLVGGQTVELGPLTTSAGGAVPNTGISLRRLGVPVRAMGQLASDLLGHELRRLLEAGGLETTYLSRTDGATSYTIVLASPETDRIFLHYPGPATTFSAANIAWDAVAGAGVFHLGYPPLLPVLYADDGAGLAEMMRRAKELGATTSLDMCTLPAHSEGARQDWPAIFEAVLPHVDLLLPGMEEMILYLKPALHAELAAQARGSDVLSVLTAAHVTRMAGELIEMGAGAVGLKAGRLGMYVRTGSAGRLSRFGRVAPAGLENWAGRELWEPGFKARQIVTATGAGDAAVAGFLAGLMRGLPVESVTRYACALGALNLEAADATSSIRSWEETTRLIEDGWEKNTFDRELPGWHFDDAAGQWVGPHDARVDLKPGGRRAPG